MLFAFDECFSKGTLQECSWKNTIKFILERRVFHTWEEGIWRTPTGYKNNVQANTEWSLMHSLISFTD